MRETTRVDGPDAETTALAGLTAEDQATMQDLIREAQYQFTWQVSDGVWAYRAPNRAHDLSLSLAADGFHAARYSAEGELLWDFGLSLAAYGGQTFPPPSRRTAWSAAGSGSSTIGAGMWSSGT